MNTVRDTITDEIDNFRDILTAYLFNTRDLNANEMEILARMTTKSVYDLLMLRLLNNGFIEKDK